MSVFFGIVLVLVSLVAFLIVRFNLKRKEEWINDSMAELAKTPHLAGFPREYVEKIISRIVIGCYVISGLALVGAAWLFSL